MPREIGGARTNLNPALIALKPRQVLLAESHAQPPRMTTKNHRSKALALDAGGKSLLHRCILRYLLRNGFSKTVKRFMAEAQIENVDWESSSHDLEEMYCRYLDACHHSDTILDTSKKQEAGSNGTAKGDGNVSSFTHDEIIGKNRKRQNEKGRNSSDCNAVEEQSNETIRKPAESDKNLGETLADRTVTRLEEKSMKKKKSQKGLNSDPTEKVESEMSTKHADQEADTQGRDESTKTPKDQKKKSFSVCESFADTIELAKEEVLSTEKQSKDVAALLQDAKPDAAVDVERKDKKKKKSSTNSPAEVVGHQVSAYKAEVMVDNLVHISTVDMRTLFDGKKDRKGNKQISVDKDIQPSADATEKDKKSSKKRKRSASVEMNASSEVKAFDETKRRKAEEAKNDDPSSTEIGFRGSVREDLQADFAEPRKKSVEQHGRHTNGKIKANGSHESDIGQANEKNGGPEMKGEKSGARKTIGKQHNGSAEPKTVNAFQRVRIDEVVFSDQKLQDNSYWAKDGAETGYGAKAQEVLGLVRGRDFRHEKTKKKRGSYRGGQIDLQSHSIKFNYADDD